MGGASTGSDVAWLRPSGAEATRPELAFSPVFSVLALLVDTLAGRDLGAPPELRAALAAAAPPRARRALLPVLASGRVRQPDCIGMPAEPHRDVPFATALEQVRDRSADAVAEDVAATFPEGVPPAWLPVLDRPLRWRDDLVVALTAGWQVLGPMWKVNERVVRGEAERLGTAVLRGGLDAALPLADPRLRWAGGAVGVPTAEPGVVDVVADRLVLSPMIGLRDAFVRSADVPGMLVVGYPIEPARLRLRSRHPAPAAGDPLVALLGPVRAALLRAAEREGSVGELADRSGAGSGSLTYHLNWLVGAGLLDRRRDGRRLLLRRTERGHALVDALAVPVTEGRRAIT